MLVPVNPMLQPDEIRNIILDSGAKFVIVATELLDNLLQAISQNRFKDTVILATNYSDSVLKKFNVKKSVKFMKIFLNFIKYFILF